MTRAFRFKAPAFWASYLVNGDASGLCPGERARIDDYIALALPEGADVVDCAQEAHFSWNFGLYGGDAEGGDLLEYTALVASERKVTA
jgi:hypothetical protein